MSELIEKNGKYYQELEVVMLSENNATKIERNQLWTHDNGSGTSLRVWNNPTESVNPSELKGYCIPRNLYLISDEEIKEGDYILSKFYYEDKCVTNRAFNWILTKVREIKNGKIFSNPLSNLEGGGCSSDSSNSFKVIATTDRLRLSETNTITDVLPKLPKEFIESYIKSYNEGSPLSKVLVEVNVKSELSSGCEGLGFIKDFKSHKIKNGAIVIGKQEEKSYTEQEIIFGVRKMLASENIKFHYVREELPKFLEEAKKEIISFKTNLKK